MKLILAVMTFHVGTGLRIPVTINQQTEYLPRSLKRTFYTEELISCFQAPDPLGFTSLTCAGARWFCAHADHTAQVPF